MGAQVSINELVRKTRQRADQINSMTFDDEGELKVWLRDSLAQLHELMVARWRDFYLTSCPLSLLKDVDTYGLPFNFRALHNIYLVNGRTKVRLRPFEDDCPPMCGMMQYRLIRTAIQLLPAPSIDSPNALLIEYSSSYAPPLLDYVPIDTVLPTGWDEWVVLDVLTKMAVKTRLQRYADIVNEKGRLEAKLLSYASRRNDDAPIMRDVAGPRAFDYGWTQTSGGQGPALWTGP